MMTKNYTISAESSSFPPEFPVSRDSYISPFRNFRSVPPQYCCTCGYTDQSMSGTDKRITAVLLLGPGVSTAGVFSDCERSLEVPPAARRRSGLMQSASSLITWRVTTNAAHSMAPCSELTTMNAYQSTDQSVNAATNPNTQPRPITTDNFTYIICTHIIIISIIISEEIIVAFRPKTIRTRYKVNKTAKYVVSSNMEEQLVTDTTAQTTVSCAAA